MGRWEPGARERLVVAAVDLFTEQGYDDTTVAQIAERASGAMGPANRELGPRIRAAVAASTELQERDALKSVGMAAALTDALLGRGVAAAIARVAAELGVLAFKQGFADWSEGGADDGRDLASCTLAVEAHQ